ncbi:hypothetical protein NDU88_011909 [Pleurodeles waltl]|uniref:Integrase catalytic domain-containing protein n=1 Tax=Pleurodeles waltl TaxID=8319 RepID=A0AAV7R4G3_PLEWA|nr:hypothetical protein NDU88_011909 [Pleurodeles waltl]
MDEICHYLGVKQIRTSVYHPQTDGLVERYKLVDGAASPLGLPVSEGPPQQNRAPEETEKRKWTDCGEKERSGRSNTATEQRRVTDTATEEDQRHGWKRELKGKCLGLSATPAVVQEAHSETASHASGEAWHNQVLLEIRIREQGLSGGGAGGSGEERHRGAGRKQKD